MVIKHPAAQGYLTPSDDHSAANETTVLISILNWNSSKETAACVASLHQATFDIKERIEIHILDNGSSESEYQALKSEIWPTQITLIRSDKNLGFAAGHNLQISHAISKNFSYVWLVNNDATLAGDALINLLKFADLNPDFGAYSPIILAKDNPDIYDFCGAQHDWANLESVRASTPEEGCFNQQQDPSNSWLAGTALLLRIAAIREVGLLDENYFAYYEDDDICSRLAQAGWHCKLVCGSIARHSRHIDIYRDRPPHYFYLMMRNSVRFWTTRIPKSFSFFITYRLAGRAFITAHQLKSRGFLEKSDACLLGVQDGLAGKYGKPNLGRSPSWLIRQFAKYYFYRLHQFIDRRAKTRA